MIGLTVLSTPVPESLMIPCLYVGDPEPCWGISGTEPVVDISLITVFHGEVSSSNAAKVKPEPHKAVHRKLGRALVQCLR